MGRLSPSETAIEKNPTLIYKSPILQLSDSRVAFSRLGERQVQRRVVPLKMSGPAHQGYELQLLLHALACCRV